MALKTDLALEALLAALVAAAGEHLPTCTRNDDVLLRFTDAGDRMKSRLHMLDGNVQVRNTYMGEGDRYELAQLALITFAVEGESGAAREGKLKAGLEALSAALFMNGVGIATEAFDGLEITGDIQRERHAPDEGRQPIVAWSFTVALYLNAPTPFG